MKWIKDNWKLPVAIAVIYALTVGVYVVFSSVKPVVPTPTPQIATVNPEVKHEEKQDVPVSSPKKTIRAYSNKAKTRAALPEAVVANSKDALVASSSVAASEKRQTLSTVINLDTGEPSTYVVEAPSPWLSTENRGQLSVDYGYKRNVPQAVARVNARIDLVQTKSVHWGVSASAYTDGDYFVGLGGSYRW